MSTTHQTAATPAGGSRPSPGGRAEDVLDLAVLRDGRAVEAVRGPRLADLDLVRVRRWWGGVGEQWRERAAELGAVDGPLRAVADRVDGDVVAARRPGDVFAALAAAAAASGAPVVEGLGAWWDGFARWCGDGVDVAGLASATRAGAAAAASAGPEGAGWLTAVDAAAAAVEGAAAAEVPAVVALRAGHLAAAEATRATAAGGPVDVGALVVTWFLERGAAV